MPSVDDFAPRVISTGHKIMTVPAPSSTSIVPYKGCFVRYRIKTDASPVLDTILLANNTDWSYKETVGTDRYNNRPFGMLVNNPLESDLVKNPAGGRWQIIVFHTEDMPIRVAFRLLGSDNNLRRVTSDLLGQRFKVVGKSIQTNEGTFIIPFVKNDNANGGLIAHSVIAVPAISVTDGGQTISSPTDYGWVVCSLTMTNAHSTSNKLFLSFPYVIPTA